MGVALVHTILLVEDHQAVRAALYAWLLVTFPGYRVIMTSNGEEAVTMSEALSPDVVIMDLSLPGISGIEASRLIKNHSPESHIIILTIHEEEAYRIDAASAGASAFVAKRLMQSQLLPTIQKFLPPVDSAELGQI